MARTKAKGYGYVHIKATHRKRPGRHSKKPNKKYQNRKFTNQKKYTILATFGGFDEHNIIPVFCKQLTKYLDRITAKIILGPATKKSKELKNIEEKSK